MNLKYLTSLIFGSAYAGTSLSSPTSLDMFVTDSDYRIYKEVAPFLDKDFVKESSDIANFNSFLELYPYKIGELKELDYQSRVNKISRATTPRLPDEILKDQIVPFNEIVDYSPLQVKRILGSLNSNAPYSSLSNHTYGLIKDLSENINNQLLLELITLESFKSENYIMTMDVDLIKTSWSWSIYGMADYYGNIWLGSGGEESSVKSTFMHEIGHKGVMIVNNFSSSNPYSNNFGSNEEFNDAVKETLINFHKYFMPNEEIPDTVEKIANSLYSMDASKLGKTNREVIENITYIWSSYSSLEINSESVVKLPETIGLIGEFPPHLRELFVPEEDYYKKYITPAWLDNIDKHPYRHMLSKTEFDKYFPETILTRSGEDELKFKSQPTEEEKKLLSQIEDLHSVIKENKVNKLSKQLIDIEDERVVRATLTNAIIEGNNDLARETLKFIKAPEFLGPQLLEAARLGRNAVSIILVDTIDNQYYLAEAVDIAFKQENHQLLERALRKIKDPGFYLQKTIKPIIDKAIDSHNKGNSVIEVLNELSIFNEELPKLVAKFIETPSLYSLLKSDASDISSFVKLNQDDFATIYKSIENGEWKGDSINTYGDIDKRFIVKNSDRQVLVNEKFKKYLGSIPKGKSNIALELLSDDVTAKFISEKLDNLKFLVYLPPKERELAHSYLKNNDIAYLVNGDKNYLELFLSRAEKKDLLLDLVKDYGITYHYFGCPEEFKAFLDEPEKKIKQTKDILSKAGSLGGLNFFYKNRSFLDEFINYSDSDRNIAYKLIANENIKNKIREDPSLIDKFLELKIADFSEIEPILTDSVILNLFKRDRKTLDYFGSLSKENRELAISLLKNEFVEAFCYGAESLDYFVKLSEDKRTEALNMLKDPGVSYYSYNNPTVLDGLINLEMEDKKRKLSLLSKAGVSYYAYHNYKNRLDRLDALDPETQNNLLSLLEKKNVDKFSYYREDNFLSILNMSPERQKNFVDLIKYEAVYSYLSSTPDALEPMLDFSKKQQNNAIFILENSALNQVKSHVLSPSLLRMMVDYTSTEIKVANKLLKDENIKNFCDNERFFDLLVKMPKDKRTEMLSILKDVEELSQGERQIFFKLLDDEAVLSFMVDNPKNLNFLLILDERQLENIETKLKRDDSHEIKIEELEYLKAKFSSERYKTKKNRYMFNDVAGNIYNTLSSLNIFGAYVNNAPEGIKDSKKNERLAPGSSSMKESPIEEASSTDSQDIPGPQANILRASKISSKRDY